MCIKFFVPETLTKYVKDYQGSSSRPCKQLKIPLPNSPTLDFDYDVGFLGRPPGPEMEYCTDRESYSLAAGLALGMVCLGVNHTNKICSYCRYYCTVSSTVIDYIVFMNILLLVCHFLSSFSLQPSYLYFFFFFFLQHGSNLIGMTDLNVPEQLYQYMVGGHRRAQAGASRERHKSPSYQIKVRGQILNSLSNLSLFI